MRSTDCVSGSHKRRSSLHVFALVVLFLLLSSSTSLFGTVGNSEPERRFLKGEPKHSIPLSKIKVGIPRVDGIPALTDPRFVSVGEGSRLKPDDRLMVVVINNRVRGYPYRILNWHELVNDRLSEIPILVTWCPLCGSGVVFDRRVDGRVLEFGVSGLLYQSDVLFYDRQTDSLWSQLERKGVVGPNTGKKLKTIPHSVMDWSAFRRQYPEGRVLSFNTGYSRDYDRDPYQSYKSRDRLMFPVQNTDSRLNNKTPVIGVTVDGESRAYTRSFLRRTPLVHERIGGNRALLVLEWKGAVRVYRAPVDEKFRLRNGELVGKDGTWRVREDRIVSPGGSTYERHPHVNSYWFAWATFHPGTRLRK